jgi:CDP-2,3-bis-(O-geranylgeranyl)-sn-glycerol synthase
LADLSFIISSAIIMVPAYLANGMPVLFGGGRPIDGGKNFFDGRRLLGDGKTVRGAVAGVMFGVVGCLLTASFLNLVTTQSFPLPLYALLGLVVGSGTVSGDLIGAFIKRRANLPRGAPAPVLDQLGFILVALLFIYLFNLAVPLLTLTVEVFFAVLVVTPFIHITANVILFLLGKKKEPW